MKRTLCFFILMGVAMLFFSKKTDSKELAVNAYDFSFTKLHSQEKLLLSNFKGKVVVIVNTASKCGFTPQYEGLEKMYEKYKDKGLVILGVPSNDFGKQEPGSADDIEKFCKLNYGVTFPMTEKEVVSGSDAAPFYVWAKKKLGSLSAPKWNFHKYVLDRNGNLVDFFISTTAPDNERFVKKIETLLAQ